MALELDSSSLGSFNVPSLTDSDYRVPSNGPSRRASRRGSSPLSSSPAPQRREEDDEDKIPPLDPRRFTPPLHANLVSEILSLRREVEAKNGMVLGLEESLSAARDENAELTQAAAARDKEGRTLKRQMQALEGGTLTAIEDMARERDQAVDTLAETRRRLEVTQKKARGQQDDADKTAALWERDQDRWEQERRNLERKLHVTEGRLRAVLAEVEAGEQQRQTEGNGFDHVPPARPSSRASGRRSSASRRRDGTNTIGSEGARAIRLSNIYETDTAEGTTLADELRFSEDEDGEDHDVFDMDAGDSDDAGYVSPEALPEESLPMPVRSTSVQSHRVSMKARKLLGLAVEDEEDEQDAREMAISRLEMRPETRTETRVEARSESRAETRNESRAGTRAETRAESRIRLRYAYKDSATQFSPPPSPVLRPQPVEKAADLETTPQAISGLEAKETSQEAESSPGDVPTPAVPRPKSTTMVSSACQTIEQPLSPPDTPIDNDNPPFPSFAKTIEMASASTQTQSDEVIPLQVAAAMRNKFLDVGTIPTISIRPPSSGSIRSSVVLPPQTKNAACQALVQLQVRSVSVQTEEIRIDQRSVKLPAHLLPSAISSNPPSPAIKTEKAVARPLSKHKPKELHVPPPPPPKSQRRKVPRETKEKGAPALGTEVEAVGPDANEEDANLSDDSFTYKEPLRKTLSKVQNSWRLVAPQGGEAEADQPDAKRRSVLNELAALEQGRNAAHAELTRHLPQSVIQEGKQAVPPASHNAAAYAEKRSDSRQSGPSTASFPSRRSRSPSEPSLPTFEAPGYVPRYPVPERFSSRNVGAWSSTAGSTVDGDERGSPTPGMSAGLRGQRPPSKKPLRKIRSAIHMKSTSTRTRSRSPPPPSAVSSSVPDSSRPDLPPLPDDEIHSPYGGTFREKYERGSQAIEEAVNGNASVRNKAPRQAQHTKAVPSSAAASTASSEQTTVVDAIAQTMIGEWMWKYVRRRKSFGLPESAAVAAADMENGKDMGTGGVRHQRWVWVAPYERAVMWSSKQPVSGTALMGKSGRKRMLTQVPRPCYRQRADYQHSDHPISPRRPRRDAHAQGRGRPVLRPLDPYPDPAARAQVHRDHPGAALRLADRALLPVPLAHRRACRARRTTSTPALARRGRCALRAKL